MIERYEAFGNDGTIYNRRKVETNTYIDGPATSVIHEAAIDYNEYTQTIRYSKDQTDFDGHGRTTAVTVFALGAAAANHVTRYFYGSDGFLDEVHVPDPTANDSSQVVYRYGFDSLGRPTSIRRPDTTVLADQSGVDITYNGVVQTSTELVKTGDGERANVQSNSTIPRAATWCPYRQSAGARSRLSRQQIGSRSCVNSDRSGPTMQLRAALVMAPAQS
jgi:hypothetical protein